jgi:HEAT repeat protein
MARKKSVDRILAGLVDASPAVRLDALERLDFLAWRRVHPTRRQRFQAFRAAVTCLRTDADARVRARAAQAFLFWPGLQALRPLLAAARDSGETARVRSQAIEGIGNSLQGREASKLRRLAMPLLLAGLRDPEPEVRFWSLYAVGVMRAREARPLVEALAASDDAPCPGMEWTVREEASDVLAFWDTHQWPQR